MRPYGLLFDEIFRFKGTAQVGLGGTKLVLVNRFRLLIESNLKPELANESGKRKWELIGTVQRKLTGSKVV